MEELKHADILPLERYPSLGSPILFIAAALTLFTTLALALGSVEVSSQGTAYSLLAIGSAVFLSAAFTRQKLVRASAIAFNFSCYVVFIGMVTGFVVLTDGPASAVFFFFYIISVLAPQRVPVLQAILLNTLIAGGIIFIFVKTFGVPLEVEERQQLGFSLLYLMAVATAGVLARYQVERAFGAYLKEHSESKRLAEAAKLKDELAFIAAHELRSPVTTIRGYLSLFRSGDFGQLSQAAQQALEVMWQSIERLRTLVADLLDVSRIESGKLRLVMERVDAGDLVAGVCAGLRPKAEEKEHDLVCNAASIRGVLIDADAVRLQEVFTNIVDNAIKYTPPHGIIKVDAEHEDGRISVMVSDTGPGIPDSAKKHIFERFYRVPRKGEQIEGTGLGLFISKNLVVAMHGTISFQSKEGEGTTFTVVLPSVSKDSA